MNADKKRWLNITLILSLALLAGAALYFLPAKKTAPMQPARDLNDIFEMGNKRPDAKIYYSDQLGVGFTYMPDYGAAPDTWPVAITEEGNKIYVHVAREKPEQGQVLEVFTKDPDTSLEEAIQDQFLSGYDPADCFVSPSIYKTKSSNYISMSISFPSNSDPEGPWWANGDKCPPDYRDTNGIQYFLMNRDVPGKFIFLRIGQSAITGDGGLGNEGRGSDWSSSIEILK